MSEKPTMLMSMDFVWLPCRKCGAIVWVPDHVVEARTANQGDRFAKQHYIYCFNGHPNVSVRGAPPPKISDHDREVMRLRHQVEQLEAKLLESAQHGHRQRADPP